MLGLPSSEQFGVTSVMCMLGKYFLRDVIPGVPSSEDALPLRVGSTGFTSRWGVMRVPPKGAEWPAAGTQRATLGWGPHHVA